MASEDEEFAYSADEVDDEDQDEENVDVDWEDVATLQPIDSVETPAPVALQKATESMPTLQQMDWEDVNRSLADTKDQNAASIACKKRRPPIRLTKDEKQREKALHETHLLLLLATRVKWMQFSRSQLLRGLLLSLTATHDVDFFAEIKQQPLSYSLALLVRWFHREFQLVETKKPSSGEIVTESSLINIFFARAGKDNELSLLFGALCGALQLRYRLTFALDPVLVQRGKAFEASFRQRSSKRRRSQKVAGFLLKRKMLPSDSEEEKEEVDKELDPESTETIDRVFWLWCEVLDEKSKRWIHVDVVRRLVDRPQEVEVLRGRTARFSYVISIQDDGLLVDVTSRYTVRWSKSLALRLADSWLKQVLERYNEDTVRVPTVVTTSLLKAEDVDKALNNEKKELERLKLAEGMPSSVEGFRKHHLYCLERHLGHLQCLHPRKAVGVFNGQSVFLREHVQRLQSAFKWRRLGRVVKDDERQKPAKWQSRGSSNPGGSHDDSDDTSARKSKDGPSLALFGLWQTTEFEPAPMVDGRVPKNKYGNIEIWSPAHVPRGAVHLQLSRVATIAESLGIDYAPAVVGFEVHNGRTMPKITGIVVAQHNQGILLDAHAENQQQMIKTAIAHNQKLVLKRWEKLTKRLLLRQRLEDDYETFRWPKKIQMQRQIRQHLRSRAAFSTRAEWQDQVTTGPTLQDFLPKRCSEPVQMTRSKSSEDSLHQIRRMLADIRQSPHQAPKLPQLVDSFGRMHTYLRISLTERCNLRCRYCMPEKGVPLQPMEDLLTSSEIIRVAKLFAFSGITRIRLTGGEPLLRRDLIELVTDLRAIQGIESVGLTTNGVTLSRKLLALQQAGVDRLNISLDTLKADKFTHITRRQGFTRVRQSIVEAETLGFSPLKINCVVQRDFNLDEIVDFVAFTENHAVDVRFIEWMPFDSNRWNDTTFVSFKEMMTLIQTEFTAVEKLQDGANDTSKAFHVPGFKGQFGFITSMSEHFCGSCNRLRLTADGNLKVCLFGNTEVSLRDAMRLNVTDDDIRDIIDVAVKRKKFALGGHGDMYGLSKAKNRPMILIGG